MRRAKYDPLIRTLNDNQLYSTGQIAKLALAFFDLDRYGPGRDKARAAMHDRAMRHGFPEQGDGIVAGAGTDYPVVGWYGARWKNSLKSGRRKQGRKVPDPASRPTATPSKGLDGLLARKRSGKGRVERKGRKHTSPFLKFRLGTLALLGLCIGLLVGFAAIVQEFSKLEQGYQILNEQGPAAAYRYFAEQDGEEIKIGQGWIALRNVNLAEAKEIANSIIVSDNRFKGNALYLLAYTEFYEGNLDKSIKVFEEALAFYEKHNVIKGISLTYFGLARVQIEKATLAGDSLILAEELLQKAIGDGVKTPNYYGLMARIEFEKGNLNNAIKWSAARLNAFFEEQNSRAEAYIDLAFYSFLKGDIQNGFNYSKSAEIIAVELNEKRIYNYNLINEILLAKHYGLDTEILEKRIENYLLTGSDPTLKRFLSLAKNQPFQTRG